MNIAKLQEKFGLNDILPYIEISKPKLRNNLNQLFAMKNSILIFALALASVVNAQSLNEILDGVYAPSESSELSSPLLITMEPQSGAPDEVLVLLLNDVSPDKLYTEGFDPSQSKDVILYADFLGGENLSLPLFEKGAYLILCLDEEGNNVGERLSILINENFVQGVIDAGYAEKRNSLIVSTRPLRIGRDTPAFVSFN